VFGQTSVKESEEMPYIINKTNGEPLLTLEDGTLNDDYSVGLLGKNTIGYGEVQNENFIHLLENFAGISPPSGNILTGQIYYNSDKKQINVYDGAQWKTIGDSIVHPKDPTLPIANQGLGLTNLSQGSFWLNSTTKQIFVYDNGWHLVGPEAAEGFGTTRSVSEIIVDTAGTNHPIIKILINDTVIAVCSSTLFTIAASNAVPGFSVIKPGITLSTLVDIKGNIDGNSLTATRLQTPRTINGVAFDGTTDITVSAASSATLSRGQYLVGSNFNGSAPATWSVDATSESNPSKIVVRNEEGDFSARRITANLIGNVTGNVFSTSGTSQFNDVVANRFEGNLTGSLSGLASSATRLETPRTINGVAFDGTASITIKAVAPNSIVPGEYIQGNAFDGSVGRSWNVLATPNNDSGKIVARDSQGNFVANTITSNILGNVTGNINSSGVSNFNILNSTQISGSLTGNVTGNSTTATRLQFPRAINGVLFDGTTPIVVKANTNNFLNRGAHLLGENFDGSASVTWSVDASSANLANKVVVRDNTGNFSANTITASFIGNVTGNLTGNVTGNVNGTTTGTHVGNVVGNVSGNLSGNASTATSLTNEEPFLRSRGGINQGSFNSAVSNGFYSVNKDGHSSSLLTWNAGGSTGPVQLDVSYFNEIRYRNQTDSSTWTTWKTLIHNENYNNYSPTLTGGGASGTWGINISGNAASATTASTANTATNNVLKSGDSMSGYLTLVGSPINANHAATKAYVDAASAYTITYGNTQYSTTGFTNRVGWWIDTANHFDVFPPFGKSIGNLVAFIPSIAVIHFAGGVNGDDSMRCTWGWVFVSGGWRIRVWVQNTEQRSTPAANWLAIWR
jgi:hypothetical protein